MEYSGKLYGKVGNTYFPLLATAEEVYSLIEENNRLKEELEQVKNSCLDDIVPMLKRISSVIDESVENAESDAKKWEKIYDAVELLQSIAEDNSMFVRN